MSKIVFGWAAGDRYRVSAQVAGERIEQIRKQRGGEVTREAVVEDARPPASPLHPAFEWDDAKAAELHRLAQAGDIIRHIVVLRSDAADDDQPVRHYVAIRATAQDDTEDHRPATVYVSMESALRDPVSRAQMFARALAELGAFKRKYERLTELAEVFDAADRVVRRKKTRGER